MLQEAELCGKWLGIAVISLGLPCSSHPPNIKQAISDLKIIRFNGESMVNLCEFPENIDIWFITERDKVSFSGHFLEFSKLQWTT